MAGEFGKKTDEKKNQVVKYLLPVTHWKHAGFSKAAEPVSAYSARKEDR